MGRQAYLTRLALGRSPYGDPLRDDDGNLVLGPHVHDDVSKDYVQQFDEKGRPIHHDTDVANRRFRRAQNEVLRVAGVVRKKGEPAVSQVSKISREDGRADLIKDENSDGRLCWSVGILTGSCIQWWLYAMRNRIYVFKSSLEPPFVLMMRSEARAFGALPFLFSGLLWSVPAAILRDLREWPARARPTQRKLLLESRSRYGYDTEGLSALFLANTLESFYFAFEWPLRAFATLQSLQLIPPTVFPSWRSLLPWSVESPAQLSQLARHIGAGDLAAFSVTLVSSPFVFACLYEIARESLVTGIHAAILNCTVRPGEPDMRSVAGLRRFNRERTDDESDEFLLLGRELGIPLEHSRAPISGWGLMMRRRYRGPRKILACLDIAFPGVFKAFKCIPSVLRYLRSGASDRRRPEIYATCNQRYNFLAGLHSDLAEVKDHMIREEAVLQGFRLCGVDAIEADIDIEQWAAGLVRDDDDEMASTATPDALSEIEEEAIRPRSPHASEDRSGSAQGHETATASDDNIDEATGARLVADIPSSPRLPEGDISEMTIIPEATTHEATDPAGLQTLLEPANPEPVTNGTQLPPLPTPTPGIRRARSLPLNLPAVPMRRPTEIDDSIEAIAEGVRALSPDLDAVGRRELKTYRVTYLSMLSADTFAYLAGNITTSLLLLPLEIYYTRLLTRSFLLAAHQGSAGEGGRAILRDVWPLSPWLAFKEMGPGGSVKFLSRVFLTFGMQSVLSSVLWKGMALWAQWLGHHRYEWG